MNKNTLQNIAIEVTSSDIDAEQVEERVRKSLTGQRFKNPSIPHLTLLCKIALDKMLKSKLRKWQKDVIGK